ncbi:hypothetical protein ACFY8P_33435 [Streptomyces sp. NPDC012693]|uniref:hypothetical protein n=1 Tax=Streptomyces sp. NPDC012693 TaxID=3364844 RepID=UPI00367DF221
MLHTVLRRSVGGETVEPARFPHPHRPTQSPHPSLSGIYRPLAEQEKRQAYPEADEQARADLADPADSRSASGTAARPEPKPIFTALAER